MALRWGICSTGNISSDFCAAMKTLPESEHQEGRHETLKPGEGLDTLGEEVLSAPYLKPIVIWPRFQTINLIGRRTISHTRYRNFVTKGTSSAMSCETFKPYGSINSWKIAAVVSRTKENAEKFAAKYNITTSYNSYDEFAKDPNIDVVYIGSIAQEHTRLCSLMINAGKPVLCEKPLTITAEDTKMLNALAKEKNVFFMEAVWSRCMPVYSKIKEAMSKGEIGDPQVVRVSMNLPLEKIYVSLPRKTESSSARMMGMLHDCGMYTIQFALFVYGEMPVSIKADGSVIENGYDVDGCVILTFSKGQRACLMYSSKTAMQKNSACIYGEKGYIEIEDNYWAPEEVTLPSGKFISKFPESSFPFNYHQSCGLRYQAIEVRKCIQSGQKEYPGFTHKDSEMMHTIMDEIVKQIGVDFSAFK